MLVTQLDLGMLSRAAACEGESLGIIEEHDLAVLDHGHFPGCS